MALNGQQRKILNLKLKRKKHIYPHFSGIHCERKWAPSDWIKVPQCLIDITCSIICSTISLFHLFDRWKTGSEGLHWKKDRSCHSAPQWSITEYACGVMNTFHNPLDRWHRDMTEQWLLAPREKLTAILSLFLKGCCDTSAPQPVRLC